MNEIITKKKNTRMIAIIVLWVLSFLLAFWYITPNARSMRELKKKNEVLRLMVEQRQMQFDILQLELKLNVRKKPMMRLEK